MRDTKGECANIDGHPMFGDEPKYIDAYEHKITHQTGRGAPRRSRKNETQCNRLCSHRTKAFLREEGAELARRKESAQI